MLAVHSPVVPRTITVLAFDVGLLTTGAVVSTFDPLKGPVGKARFCLLTRKSCKGKNYVTLQDEMLEWLQGVHMKDLAKGVNQVGIELHWSGPSGGSGTSTKIRILEFTIRQFYLAQGLVVRATWAHVYKRFHGACQKDYRKNKELARKVALAFVVGDEHAGEEFMDRLHDLGDAYMLAAYIGEHNLELKSK
jgi:hypothetical protein